jgi:type III pantothenate kinase
LILAVDIGNTTTEIGYIKDLDKIETLKFQTDPEKTIDDWLINFSFFLNFYNLDKTNVNKIYISSVVPQVEEKITKALKKLLNVNPLLIGKDVKVPLKINYENPLEVGADRILNAFASINITNPPLMAIDFGTAVTFDVVNKNSEYDGGLIFPGLESSVNCLFSKTAKLPKVKIEKPLNIVGKNTISSIQSGIYNGYISLVEGIISKIENEYKCKFNIILTGGHGKIISKSLNLPHIFERYLPIKGIYFLDRNLKVGF